MPTLPISWMILFVHFGSDLTYTPRDNLTETWLQEEFKGESTEAHRLLCVGQIAGGKLPRSSA